MPSESLTVVNFNTWHGLNGAGTFKFGDLEDLSHRKARYELQVVELRKLDADLIFLQELNPLYARGKRLARDLNMDLVGQLDQSGIKLFGLGIPINLNTGLAILAKKKFKLRKLKGLKLSGGIGFNTRFASFQLSEFRYALIAEIQIAGRSHQVANVHLHHGPMESSDLAKKIENLFSSRLQKSLFERSLKMSFTRRQTEIKKLFAYSQNFSLVCGDLNIEEKDALLSEFKQHKLKDHFFESNVLSWDSEKNRKNHLLTRALRLTVPTFGLSKLADAVRDYDGRSRRIDYIFSKFECSDRKLILNEGENLSSDHFGLFAKLDV